MSGIHIENSNGYGELTLYGIAVAGGLINLNDVTVAGYQNTYGFYFGQDVTGTIQNAQSGGNVLFVPDSYFLSLFSSIPQRLILFASTIFRKRYYSPQIQFVDENINANGQLHLKPNNGTVYIDPINGNDDNYGFSKADAIQTFDGGLIRVQNQSTSNPVNCIRLKYFEGYFPTIKNTSVQVIENVDLLITGYDDNGMPDFLFSNTLGTPDPNTPPNIGQIKLLGNSKLYFRNINLIMFSPSRDTGASNDLTFIGLEKSHANVVFDKCFLQLGFFYSIVKSLNESSSIEIKFVNTTITGSASWTGGTASMSPTNGSINLLVDCVQINSTIPALFYSYINNGWIDANVIRNNF